jgi:hypothetical protein
MEEIPCKKELFPHVSGEQVMREFRVNVYAQISVMLRPSYLQDLRRIATVQRMAWVFEVL